MNENYAEFRLAGVIRESIVDGPGFRFVVFAQGCPHHCEGCHNPETHSFEGGYISNTDNIIEAMKKDSLLVGITLSGGEPFCQAEAFSVLARRVKEMGLNVMAYTGFTFEQLYSAFEKHPEYKKLLEQVDILIDGKFELKNRSLALKFRGSTNQRVIDVPASLEAGKAIERDFEQ